MGRADHLELGTWNAVCSMCGFKRKASNLIQNWQGQWRCPDHNEARHPQDFVRAPAAEEPPPWAQPRPAAVFVHFCSINGRSAVSGFSVSGCEVSALIPAGFDPSITPGE